MTQILIFASFAPSLSNFRGPLIEELCRRGHQVHVAAPSLSSHPEVCAWLDERNVEYHDIHLSRSGLNPLSDLLTLRALVHLMRKIGPEVFLGYTVKPVIWGLFAAQLTNVPKRIALITGLGYAFTGTPTGLRRLVWHVAQSLYRFALKRATLVFFQNPDDMNEFNRLKLLKPNVPVSLISGSGVDLEHFTAQPIPNGPIRFLLIARLLGDKGIREYVSAAEQLRLQWPKAQFHLIGGVDPSPDGISEDEVAAWHKDGKVIWHGHVSDVRAAITAAHVYVLPSYREGTPRTVLEAMSIGRPIVTTDAPGCRQTVISGENGFLVPIQDSQALSQAMEKFLLAPELTGKMGIRSRQIAEDVFDVHLINKAMLSAMSLE